MENQEITIEDLSKSEKSQISDIEIDSQASWQPNHPRSMIRIPKSKIPQRLHITQDQPFKDKDLIQQMEQKLSNLSIFRSQSGNKEQDKANMSIFKFQVKEEINQEIQNPYSQTKNAKISGDMPKVFAFEVENNIRKGLQEILKPMMGQHERVVLNVTDLQTIFKDLKYQVNKLNKKLDLQIPLTDQIKEANQRTIKMKDEYYKHIKELKTDIFSQQKTNQAQDLKIQSIIDDRATFLFNQQQLQHEIRQFEKLFQDLSFENAQQQLNQQEKHNDKINELKIEID